MAPEYEERLPLLILTALLVGGMTMTTYFVAEGEGRLIVSFCVILAALAGWFGRASLRKDEYIRVERVEAAYEKLNKEIAGHAQEHQVRPYDPESLGQQMASQTAMLTQMHKYLGIAAPETEVKIDDVPTPGVPEEGCEVDSGTEQPVGQRLWDRQNSDSSGGGEELSKGSGTSSVPKVN